MMIIKTYYVSATEILKKEVQTAAIKLELRSSKNIRRKGTEFTNGGIKRMN